MLTSLFLRIRGSISSRRDTQEPGKAPGGIYLYDKNLGLHGPLSFCHPPVFPSPPHRKKRKRGTAPLFDTTWGEGTSTTSLEELFAIRVYKLPVLPSEWDFITKK